MEDNSRMKKILIGTVLVGLVILTGVVRAESWYNPYPYINQIYTISNHVNYDNWSQANPDYKKLQSICTQIKTARPDLAKAADDCVTGTQLVINGSVCNGNCHTDYNRRTYGPIVDRGLRTIDQASLVLSAYH